MSSFVTKALSDSVQSYRESLSNAHIARAEIVVLCILNERDHSRTRIAYIQKIVQPALRNASLVCRAWSDAARKYLYNEIYISSPKALDLLHRTLGSAPEIRPLVQRFYFTGTIFASGNILDSRVKADLSLREKQILDLCPNLVQAIISEKMSKRESRKMEAEYDALLRLGLQFGHLTHLEIHPRCDLPRIFPKKFPVLQSLKIDYRSGLYQDGFVYFSLPKLRKLELMDVRLTDSDALILPKFAQTLNSIELEMSTMHLTVDIFDPARSPFLPFRKTLESLTIVGENVDLTFSEPRALPNDGWRKEIKSVEDGNWSLEFLENLVQLCIPFCVFARAGRIKYPPRLRDLVLYNKEGTGYVRFSYCDIAWGLTELYRMISLKKKGKALKELKRVEIPADGIKMHKGFGRFLSRVDTGIVLKFGEHTNVDDSEIGPLARPGSLRYLLEVARFKLYLLQEKRKR